MCSFSTENARQSQLAQSCGQPNEQGGVANPNWWKLLRLAIRPDVDCLDPYATTAPEVFPRHAYRQPLLPA